MIKEVICEAPILQKTNTEKVWEYHEPWKCKLIMDVGVLDIHIRKGYTTDFASVPTALQNIFDSGAREFGVLIASQVHDCIYSSHQMSRDFADDAFYDILRYYGMSTLKAYMYYLAVHLFGFDAYYKRDVLDNTRQTVNIQWMVK